MIKIDKIGKLIKDAWLIIGSTILLFCLLEGSLSLVFFIRDRLRAPAASAADCRITADTYSDATWVANYWQEFHRSGVVRWRSYVYWRRPPYHGNYINIDDNGIRATVYTETMPQGSPTPVKIFMFGGSTMWGEGARDAFTIPSVVAKELRQKGIAAEVTNFGETGYVSTQEVITLLLQLQKGKLPDLVIFYDGVNDMYSAYQQHVAGLPQNEHHREEEFDLSQPGMFTRREKMDLQNIAKKLSTVRFAKILLERLGFRYPKAVTAESLSFDIPTPENETLVQDLLAIYRSNIDIVNALSERCHFKCLFYWQPTIFQKTQLTAAYELGKRAEMQAIGQFVGQTYEAVHKSELAEKYRGSFHDISLVFADVRQPMYIDWCHLGESGNEIIAKIMASDILGLLIANKE
ncbi:hypothetical protein BIY37_02345 [Candidatus Brocadia sapporoensis]|uniref:SGNH hydrolase-type esterase domain-containing protein n=1 Tax=Candidatus Brocadia sapporoensis TaxID=392547 RepID=A0A1V6M2M2_9BACT|nr:SGNH/GDSL hydrolase family protein [Candidatus Brocadia sapporoensis]MDG6005854.1 SGNH/GDSL hydrolase family protein [Candidatus Brocadia sp.]OQD46642.1 hypothetical protein BIY37_02345 [Candidatus Brocadia sapporoensis]